MVYPVPTALNRSVGPTGQNIAVTQLWTGVSGQHSCSLMVTALLGSSVLQYICASILKNVLKNLCFVKLVTIFGSSYTSGSTETWNQAIINYPKHLNLVIFCASDVIYGQHVTHSSWQYRPICLRVLRVEDYCLCMSYLLYMSNAFYDEVSCFVVKRLEFRQELTFYNKW